MSASPFGLQVPQGVIPGHLMEVLKPRSLVGSMEVFHSEIVSSQWFEEKTFTDAPVIVFDGARGFRALSHRWPQAHWLVLLDRTETQFLDAVEMIDEMYIDRHTIEAPFQPGQVPPGIEVLTFFRGSSR
jgi:hypothetical protein